MRLKIEAGENEIKLQGSRFNIILDSYDTYDIRNIIITLVNDTGKLEDTYLVIGGKTELLVTDFLRDIPLLREIFED